jgi:predicted Zn-dependent protease
MKRSNVLRVFLVMALCAGSLSAVESTNTFVFTNVDLEFLKQADLADQKFEREGMVSHDEALNSYVTRVGLSMLPAGTAPERVKWSFKVFRDPMPNAFALPNGSIYVNTGLLSLLENEDQLASVLAHEITHVTDRHGYFENRDYRKKSAIISVAVFAGSMAPGNKNWGAAIQLAATTVPIVMTASIYGYRRERERDADIYAFNKIMEGNYDAREMINAFHLLERKDEADDTPKATPFYSDHPKLEDRISYLTSLINAKAPPTVPPAVLAERRMRYQSLTEAIVREDIRLAILAHHSRTALARATKLTEFHPDSADNLYTVAEAYRGLGPWTPRPSYSEMTGGGRRKSESLERRFTPLEEDRELLSKPEGRAAWEDNKRKAEENYQKALLANPGHAKTYSGLGQLYENEGKGKEAVAAYQKYLELNPNALDQTLVKQRISTLQRSIAP